MSSLCSAVAELYPGVDGVHHGFLRVGSGVAVSSSVAASGVGGAAVAAARATAATSGAVREFWFQVRHPRARGGGSRKRSRHAMQGAELVLDPTLASLVGGAAVSLLSRRLCESRDLDSFKIELEDNVSRALRQREGTRASSSARFDPVLRLAPPERVARVVAEITSLPALRGSYGDLDRLVSVDGPGLSRIELRTIDSAGREHRLRVNLSAGYPQHPPLVFAELPGGGNGGSGSTGGGSGRGNFPLDWQTGFGLRDALAQVDAAIEELQGFWNEGDEIDARCWVLDPELRKGLLLLLPSDKNESKKKKKKKQGKNSKKKKKGGDREPIGTAHAPRSCVYRRVAVGKHCSLQLRIDPSNPRRLSGCRLLGSDAVAAPLRRKLRDAISRGDWDEERRSLLENLEAALGFVLPPPTQESKQTLAVECAICYAYRLGTVAAAAAAAAADTDGSGDGGGEGEEGRGRGRQGERDADGRGAAKRQRGGGGAAGGGRESAELPEVVCPNAKCSRLFHPTCLSEWLRSLPSSTNSFGVLHGICPYCSGAISC